MDCQSAAGGIPYSGIQEMLVQLLALGDIASATDVKRVADTIVATLEVHSDWENIVQQLSAFNRIFNAQVFSSSSDEEESLDVMKALVCVLLEMLMKQHTIVISLVKIRNLDNASFEVLQAVVGMTGSHRLHIFFAGLQPLAGSLLESAPPEVTDTIRIDRLSFSGVRNMLAETFNLVTDRVPDPVVSWIYRRVYGNAMCARALCEMLKREDLLEVGEDGSAKVAPLAKDRIISEPLPEKFVNGMRARIDSLSPGERRLLKNAAIIGGVFVLGELIKSVGNKMDSLSIQMNLFLLLKKGLLTQTSERRSDNVAESRSGALHYTNVDELLQPDLDLGEARLHNSTWIKFQSNYLLDVIYESILFEDRQMQHWQLAELYGSLDTLKTTDEAFVLMKRAPALVKRLICYHNYMSCVPRSREIPEQFLLERAESCITYADTLHLEPRQRRKWLNRAKEILSTAKDQETEGVAAMYVKVEALVTAVTPSISPTLSDDDAERETEHT
eukprot:GFYU01006556.1.p1 GENE.GFYU01006556.1~~GFYU01006556.1.p1  ORF type:complete len:514 (+),score=54.46 GFYU01006556.1:42-1544(+)